MESEIAGKAHTLSEALNRLDPERPLRTSEELRQFFVQRPYSPIDEIEILLEETERPQKFLFSGHRGSGKSTELARLEHRLEDEFFVVPFSAMQSLNLFELQYVDVLLGLGLELAQVATEEEVEVTEGVLDHVLRFTREVTEEVQLEEREGAEIGATLNAIAGTLSTKLRSEDVTRRTVREKVTKRIADLLESIELLAREIERSLGRDLLVVVDDLDKTDLATAKSMFYEHATTLAEPPVSIIYTFPTPLRHDNAFPQIRTTFSNVEILPNLKTQRQDGTTYNPGLRMTKQIITKRIADDLIENGALDELARLSSGIPRQLVILARQACLDALKGDRDVIDEGAVQQAAIQQRNEYEVLLDRSQRELLRAVHDNKEINNDEAHRELLHNLSVLEYKNDTVWYDVHPLVKPLIDAEPDA